MKARSELQQSFPIGTRVRLNEAGQGQVTKRWLRFGVIEGYSRDGEAVWIRWDGNATRQLWDCVLLVAEPR